MLYAIIPETAECKGDRQPSKLYRYSYVSGQYTYDGDGKRVKKAVPSTGETTVFAYDASGKMVAEYSTVIPQDPKVSYTTADHLGFSGNGRSQTKPSSYGRA